MASTPYHVAHAFVAGRRDRAGEFVTDGTACYSYAMRLAHKGDDGQVVYDYLPLAYGNKAPSMTTARHMRALESVCVPPKNDKRNPARRNPETHKPTPEQLKVGRATVGLMSKFRETYGIRPNKTQMKELLALAKAGAKSRRCEVCKGRVEAFEEYCDSCGNGSYEGAAVRRNPSSMTKAEFLQMLKENVKTHKWLNGTFDVEGKKVGVKAFELWVQKLTVEGFPYEFSGNSFHKSQKAMAQEVDEFLSEALSMSATEAESIRQRQAQARQDFELRRNPARDGEYSDMNPKINISVDGKWLGVTNWYSTAKAAKVAYERKHPGCKVVTWIDETSVRGSGGRVKSNPALSAKDQKRLSDASAEIFYLDANEARSNRAELADMDKKAGKRAGWHAENSEHNGLLHAGWYYWCCLPGCLPEGAASGPFPSEYAAGKDCVESWGLYEQ